MENLNILNYFDNYGIALQRNNADSTVNFYGQQLLDFCKYNNIFLLNGRLGADKLTPKHAKTETLLIISFPQSSTFRLSILLT